MYIYIYREREEKNGAAQCCCGRSLCKCVHMCVCVRTPRGVVLRGEMIVALTHQLLFHGCLVKKLVDLITGSGGWEGTRPRVAV